MAIEYNFKYMPLVGKLSGESMVRQTETAINEIAQIVNENTAQAEIINTLAETANLNSAEALEKANEALNTSSRVYITETSAVNLNNYCESQLIYIGSTASQNLPVSHKGFLEVKTNDDKTQATQVFTDDVDRKFYVRTGAITATTTGDVTTYTASYGDWVDIPNVTDLDNYLALAGGVMSGDIEFSASEWKIKGSDIDNDAELSIVGATDNLNGSSLNLYGRNHTEGGAFELNANNGTYTKTLKGDAIGNLKWDGNSVALAKDFLPLSGGTLTGNVYTTPYYDSTIVDPEGGQTLIVSKGKVAKGTAPSNDEWHTMVMAVDNSGLTNNANKYGQVETAVKTDGSVETNVQAYKNEANSTTSVKISVGYDANGNAFTSAPTPTAGDNSTKIATTAFVNTKAGDYLPLSGGTMTGGIKRNGVAIINTADNGYVQYNGGKDDTSSYICIYGKNHSSNPGTINLRAYDGTNSRYLHLEPNGTLNWGGLDISPQTWKSSSFSDKSAASGTRTNLGSYTLTKGTWLICIAVNFPSNANGYRDINISNSSAGSQLDRYRYYRCAPANGSDTHITWTIFDSASANITRYVNVLQNSGSALTVGGGYIAFRLSNDA